MSTVLPAAMWIVGMAILVVPSRLEPFPFALGASMASVGCYWVFWA